MAAPKIASYRIISADNIYSLMREVNHHIQTGHEPIGGVAVDNRHIRLPMYLQAMTLPESVFDGATTITLADPKS